MSMPHADRADASPWGTAVGSTLAVAGFQLRRLLSWQRLLLAALGAIFPAAVMLAVRRTAHAGLDAAVAAEELADFIKARFNQDGLSIK